jgi:hypothetical protein
MKNHLRARGLDERAQRRAVIDIRLDEAAAFRQHQNVMQVGTRIRCQSKTGHFRAHFAQPKRQPCPFEAGMAGDENSAVIPERCQHQRFQGATPDDHGCAN